MTTTTDTTTPTEEVNATDIVANYRADRLTRAMRLLDLHTGELAVLVDDLAQLIGPSHPAEWWTVDLISEWVDSPWVLANAVTHITAMAIEQAEGTDPMAAANGVRDWLKRIEDIGRRRGFPHRLQIVPAHRVAPGLDEDSDR